MSLLAILTVLIPLSWDKADYARYDATSFFSLPEVNQPIELDKLNTDLLEAAIFYASNEVRAQEGLERYTFDSKLNKAARFHSENMKKYKFVGHVFRKKRVYRTPFDRIKAFGGNEFNKAAENVARINVYRLGKNGEFAITSEKKLVDANGKPLKARTYAELARYTLEKWMNSPGHRKNLLDDYGYLGCGISAIAYTKEGLPEIYLTQNFAGK